MNKVVVLKPGNYWFSDEVPTEYGKAFEITLPTKVTIVGEQGNWYKVSNAEKINTSVKTFEADEVGFFVPKTDIAEKIVTQVYEEDLKIIARGISDEITADQIARQKQGKKTTDVDDDTKFMVVAQEKVLYRVEK